MICRCIQRSRSGKVLQAQVTGDTIVSPRWEAASCSLPCCRLNVLEVVWTTCSRVLVVILDHLSLWAIVPLLY